MPDPRSVTAEDLLDRYEGVLLDAYGVLLTEAGPLPGAARFVKRLHDLGKPFCVLTNDAAKLPSTTARRLQAMGVDIPVERVVTSGSLLVQHFARHGLQGRSCAVLGPPDSVHYVLEAGGRIVPAHTDFEVLVIGDTLETDIQGANNAGIDAVLIGTGVSVPDWSATPAALRPVATLAGFTP